MANDRDPRSDLGAWLGEELRRARLDGGFTSQDQLARELGFDRTVIVKAETGARPPSEDVAPKIAEMFPSLCNGLYVRLAAIKMPCRYVDREVTNGGEGFFPICRRWNFVQAVKYYNSWVLCENILDFLS